MGPSIGQDSRAANPRRFAWSLTTSGTVHGTVFGIASLLGGWFVTVDGAPQRDRAQTTTRPAVRIARVDFEELVESEPEVTPAEPELDDCELIETPPMDSSHGELVPEPVVEAPEDPLAGAARVTQELSWQVEVAEPVEPEPVDPEPWPAEVAAVEPTPTEVEIALEAGPPVVEATVLAAPAPRYPRLSIRQGEEGSVVCRLYVSAEGSVTRVDVLQTSGYSRLDEAAVAALREWRFAPRQERGHAVATTIRHPVTFVLEAE